jgi:hypothetical protein
VRVIRIITVFAAAAVLAWTQGVFAATPDKSLQRAMDRGKTLFLYDRAAWVTSDDATARIPLARQGEVGGWVVTSKFVGFHVDYFGKDAGAERVIYSADLIDGKVSNATVFPISSEPTLKEPALRMARALRAARAEMIRHSDWQPCARAPFNTVVLPPEGDGTVPVYFLTPQTQLDSFPFGGHYEVDVAADGSTARTRPFTKGCITMSKPPLGGRATPSALFITHLLDPHPTEIHVFEQYNIGLPVYVGTGPKSVWKVENGNVDDVSSMMAK